MKYNIRPDGHLEICVTPKEQQRLQEMRKEGQSPDHVVQWGTQRCEHEVLEGLICNSELEWVQPEWVGALTSAPMLGIFADLRPLHRSEDARFQRIAGHWDDRTWVEPVDKCWAYMSYQVRSFLDDLADQGFCIFQSGNDQPVSADKLKKFTLTYARTVVMTVDIEARDQEDADNLALALEVNEKLPEVYDHPWPKHVKDVYDDEAIWEIKPQ
jgi:hypothetical protein